jgi:hypothetical protein
MTDLRQAAQQALEALESGLAFDAHSTVLQNLRTALAQPEQGAANNRIYECAKRLVEHADFKLGGILSADSKAKDIPSNAVSHVKSRHLAALRDALSLPEQEPVAWQYKTAEAGIFVSDQLPQDVQVWQDIEWSIPLYTTPPQRPWVGLTDEDVNRESAPIAQQMKLAFHAGMYVAQKILKERNT